MNAHAMSATGRRGNISSLSTDYLPTSCWHVESHGNSNSFWPFQRVFISNYLLRIILLRQVFFLKRKTNLLKCSFKVCKKVEPNFVIYLDAFDQIIKARCLFQIIFVKLTITSLCRMEQWSMTTIILSLLSSLWPPFGITTSSHTRMSPNVLAKWFACV